MLCHSALVSSRNGFIVATPALLTSTSTSSPRSAAVTAFSSAMSSAIVRQTPPPISISPLSDLSSLSERATATMSYAAESLSAVARPIPREAPVTSAVSFAISILPGEASAQCSRRHEHRFRRAHERREGERPRGHALRELVRQLALSLGEHRLDDIRPRARIAIPVLVETLDECFADHRLQLPRAQVARGVVARIYIDEGIGRVVACLLYTSPSPRDGLLSRMPSSA